MTDSRGEDRRIRRALVTGAGHGIGAAIARAPADDGCPVAVHYRRTGPPSGFDVAAQGDLAEPGWSTGWCAGAVSAWRLDIVVCNAGHLVGPGAGGWHVR